MLTDEELKLLKTLNFKGLKQSQNTQNTVEISASDISKMPDDSVSSFFDLVLNKQNKEVNQPKKK